MATHPSPGPAIYQKGLFFIADAGGFYESFYAFKVFILDSTPIIGSRG